MIKEFLNLLNRMDVLSTMIEQGKVNYNEGKAELEQIRAAIKQLKENTL